MALPAVAVVAIGVLKSIAIKLAVKVGLGNLAKKAGSFLKQYGLSILWRLLGQAIKHLGLGRFLLTEIVQWISALAWEIWNFNWNTSPSQLERQLQSNWTALNAALGGLAGNMVGSLTCGAVSGASIAVFNPAWALVISRELGQEALFEALGHLDNVTRTAGNLLARQLFLSVYKNNRALFNWLANNFGGALGGFLGGLTGSSLSWQEYRKRRGSDGIVSFADFVNESLETLNPNAQAFWEEFLEEASESCWEAFYVVADGLETLAAEERLNRTVPLGQVHTVVVTPDRELDEQIILTAPEELLKNQLVTQYSTYRMVEDRDIGQIAGMSLIDYVRANPQTLRLAIHMFSVQQPPFYRQGADRIQKAEINIPDVDISKLSWERIKRACGGSNGYVYGNWVCSVRLDNGRSMSVYADSQQNAESRLEAFLELTRANPLTFTCTEELRKGERLKKDQLQKKRVRIYPGYFHVINRKEVIDPTNARTTSRQIYKDRKNRIQLWTDTEPEGTREILQEILRWGFV